MIRASKVYRCHSTIYFKTPDKVYSIRFHHLTNISINVTKNKVIYIDGTAIVIPFSITPDLIKYIRACQEYDTKAKLQAKS